MNKILILVVCIFAGIKSIAQPENRWQQRVSYKMTIDMDAAKNQFKGRQKRFLPIPNYLTATADLPKLQ